MCSHLVFKRVSKNINVLRLWLRRSNQFRRRESLYTEIKMLKVALCLVLALSLTNALPVGKRLKDDFDDHSRDAVPKESSDFDDLYDAYLNRREPNDGKWTNRWCSRPLPFGICALWLICGFLFCNRSTGGRLSCTTTKACRRRRWRRKKPR